MSSMPKKKKWADTLVTEWDPCHDSVLAIGEHGWSFRSGDLLRGGYTGPQQNISLVFWHSFWLSVQLLDAHVWCWGVVHIIESKPGKTNISTGGPVRKASRWFCTCLQCFSLHGMKVRHKFKEYMTRNLRHNLYHISHSKTFNHFLLRLALYLARVNDSMGSKTKYKHRQRSCNSIMILVYFGCSSFRL